MEEGIKGKKRRAELQKRYLTASEPDYFLKKYGSNGRLNKLNVGDTAGHAWYRFVLSYPPHIVRDYLSSFGAHKSSILLDPFCGTGTTLVEAKKQGVQAIGIESHPMMHFASSVKLNWSVNGEELLRHATRIARSAEEILKREKLLRTLNVEQTKLLLKNSISPLPLHKTLVLLAEIERHKKLPFYDNERLALAKSVVLRISNLHFGPGVGVRGFKGDADVINLWLEEVKTVANDLEQLGQIESLQSVACYSDARDMKDILAPNSIDMVITSPPYPNEKDYTRTTRLETVLLGFAANKDDIRFIKKGLVRSNTRGIYRTDDDDKWVENHKEIQSIAKEIEKRRIALNKTSGFERMYARAMKLYFGGMYKHFSNLREILRPGARLAYVVGDQASYLRVMIRTGQILADLAESLGYKVEGIDLFRTRLATATKEQLREEVLILSWQG